MLDELRSRLSYANVISSLALFLVLSGGTAVALNGSNTVFSDDIKNGEVKNPDLANDSVGTGKLKPGAVANSDLAGSSVGTGKIIDGAVGNADLATNAVDSPKVLNNSLTGFDIVESTLSKVGDADTLDNLNSTAFLGATAKAADSNKLDGIDSDAFVRGAGEICFNNSSEITTTSATSGPGFGVGGAGDAGETRAWYFSVEMKASAGASARVFLDIGGGAEFLILETASTTYEFRRAIPGDANGTTLRYGGFFVTSASDSVNFRYATNSAGNTASFRNRQLCSVSLQ